MEWPGYTDRGWSESLGVSGREAGQGNIDAIGPLLTSTSTPIHFIFRRTSRIGPLTDVSVVPTEYACERWPWSR